MKTLQQTGLGTATLAEVLEEVHENGSIWYPFVWRGRQFELRLPTHFVTDPERREDRDYNVWMLVTCIDRGYIPAGTKSGTIVGAYPWRELK